ncbi:MAG: alkaline phosphatase family protein [Vicinamibacteraceae bacterium]|nr:alkaline phosphatase family protein [Vicinamibacteraceae bacterium]
MKVLLVVIDAASPRVVGPAVQTGRLPVLQRLADAGAMHRAISIFPSITPAATSSIITGEYPSRSGITGASWYDEARGEVAYYGDDFWVVAREGFGSFVRDFLVRLNGDRLTAPTLFELVERGGGRRAACLNYLVYRGVHEHRARVPTPLAFLPGVPRTQTIHGPSTFCLGDFVATHTVRGRKLKDKGGLFHRFGMDDASTGALLCQLAEDRALPDFTVAYFADNDYRSHEVGPHGALPVLERVDRMLGDAFEAAGGLESFLEETCVIVTSDHGHCEILPEEEQAVIRLDQLLQEFQQATFGRPWQAADDVMLCPNMRAAQIYVQSPTVVRVGAIVRRLLSEPRVDQVLWCRRLTSSELPGYAVATSRGRLEFWRADAGATPRAHDEFGTKWTWQGDPAVLGLELEGGVLCAPDYPNLFERIAGALDSRNSGEIWVTAKPGCEFEVPGGTAHVGGASHGALHTLDSDSLLIVSGPPGLLDTRQPFRSVDVAPLCAKLLGVPVRYGVGDPRV